MDVKQHLKKLRSCVKAEVAILGSPSFIVHTISVDIKQHLKTPRICEKVEVAILGSSFLIIVMVCVDIKQHLKMFRSCVKIEVAVLASSFLIVLMVSVDVKQHLKKLRNCVKVKVAIVGTPSLIVLMVSVGSQVERKADLCFSVELSEALTLMEAQPHAELQRVDVGLGSQTLRLEYLSDCSSYTLVLRNSHKVHTFKDLLSGGCYSFFFFLLPFAPPPSFSSSVQWLALLLFSFLSSLFFFLLFSGWFSCFFNFCQWLVLLLFCFVQCLVIFFVVVLVLLAFTPPPPPPPPGHLNTTGNQSSNGCVGADGIILVAEHLQTYAMETGIPMSVVVNDDVDQQTLDNLNADVLTRGGQADCLRLYILGYIARGGFASDWI